MKVNNPNAKAVNLQSTANSSVEGKKNTSTSKVADSDLQALGTASKVNVSDRAMAMKKAKAIASDDSIDEAKVARFQALIDSGKYKVDADKIADRIIDEHLLVSE